MMGRPMDTDTVELAEDITSPPIIPKAEEEWHFTRHERKRIDKYNKKAHRYGGCNANCCDKNEPKLDPWSWNGKFEEFAKNEKEALKVIRSQQSVNLVETSNGAKEVNFVPISDDKWETITVTVDSGAFNTVGPPKTGTHFPLKQTHASSNGKNYRAANGTEIRNHGQRVVTGRNENGAKIGMPIQIADVNKVLGSVREMVESGNRVTFDCDSSGKPCSSVEHKASGTRTVIHHRNGAFQFDIKVPKGDGVDVTKVEEVAEGRNDEGFTRPGTLEADLFY